ncbi:MAG: helix-turn-helix domain-containing protein [Oscillospiraceae bacterium]|nr:helix-turn-helix domain-containing protein [Oscillospiraceae bacterium]
MILADKIIDLRKKNGWSQEDLAEKLDVSRQAISKWEGAQSVPDMVRIIRMSELFGVSTDYLLKDEMEHPQAAESRDDDSPLRTVSLEEASAFLLIREKNAQRVALGVLLCILSPVLLILLSGAVEMGKAALTEGQAAGLGLMALFVLVGAAVALFVTSSLRAAPYAYLEKEDVETLYGVSGMVRDRKEKFQPVYSRQLTIGVVLCVCSVLPLFAALLLGEEDSILQVYAVCALLILVAVGALLIVRASIIQGGFQQLLEEGDYSRAAKEEQRRYGWISGCYWMIVTAGYLAWSFPTNAWDRTWIVWPVAGVAYGAIVGIVKAMRRQNG